MTKRSFKHERDVLEEAFESYKNNFSLYEQFSAKIAELLTTLMKQSKIRYQTVECRAKSVSSFREKITRRGKDYGEPLKEMPDLSGVRAITYYPDDVKLIKSIIESEFELLSPDSGDKLDEMAPNEFGYRSVHFVVKLSKSRKNLAEWKKMNNLKCEIQVRTVLQHAWAAISHALQYKHEAEVPRGLRRRLFRLAGLLELADEEFANVRDEHQKLVYDINNSRGEDVGKLSIDRLTLKKYIAEAPICEVIMAAAKDAGFNTYNEYIEEETLAYLALSCSQAEIHNIAELDSALTSLPRDKITTFFCAVRQNRGWSGTLPLFILMLVVGIHNNRFSVELMRANGWSADRADFVLKAANNL